jgi:hypothetical protein
MDQAMQRPLPSLWREEDRASIGGALTRLRAAESQRPLRLEELVDKGDLLLLDPERPPDHCALAKEAYMAALHKHDEYVPALVGLAWFHFAVEDDAKAAMPLFQRAIRLLTVDLAEAIAGAAGCVGELESEEAARAYLHGKLQGEGILDPADLPPIQRRLLQRTTS